jgi:adenylate kinase family enzyme
MAPLEDYYRSRNFNLKKINADQYVENVFSDILDALGPCFKVYEI